MKKKIVLTGFEPFGGETINPSTLLMEAYENDSVEIIRCPMPTRFLKVEAPLREALAQEPDLLLSIGQAGGRSCFSLERVAINLMDASAPDNAGFQPRDLPIVEGGPDAYFATLPTRSAVETLQKAGIPATLSYSAGTYVCNTLFYQALHLSTGGPTRCAFLHVPYLPEQATKQARPVPSLDFATQLRGLAQLIDHWLTTIE